MAGKSRSSVGGLFVSAAVGLAASGASASIITNSPDLPPNAGGYMTPAQVHADYSGPGLLVVLSGVTHEPFANTVVRSVVNKTDELETFNSQVTGEATVTQGTTVNGPFPITLTGPVSVDVSNYSSGQLGTFNTQMTSMDVTGTLLGSPVEIMLDPANPTYGQTTITDLGSGNYMITSFFDVFTELSLDGGNTYIPQSNGPTLVQLQPVPEPTSITLLAGGALMLLRRRGRGMTSG